MLENLTKSSLLRETQGVRRNIRPIYWPFLWTKRDQYCNCSISTVIYVVQHLTKLPLCIFSNYIVFYFKIASFCHLTRPSLQFRMANWSQVLLWSQWGKSLLHLTLIFYAFSVCNLILILQFHYAAIMYCLINCKWIISWFPILFVDYSAFLAICVYQHLWISCIYLQNYNFDWKQSRLLISQTPCHLAAVTVILNFQTPRSCLLMMVLCWVPTSLITPHTIRCSLLA